MLRRHLTLWKSMTAFGTELPVLQAPRSGECCPILLKNSLSAMFDFLGGRWARHSKNQLGDQPICRLGSVRGPQPV